MNPIKTFDKDGEQTGVLATIWHEDTGPVISQVYLTTVLAWKVKGPHLHMKRRGLFSCVRGEVIVVTRIAGKYITNSLKLGDPPLKVPPGVPAALYNPNGIEALVLNMPDPPWRVGEEDEHEIKDWSWKP